MNTPVMEAVQVRRYFAVGRRLFGANAGATVKAVDGVSFAIHPAETVGIVGESGCGKTTTSKLILKLDVPDSGHVLFNGKPLQELSAAGMKEYRASVQAVFQDPFSSLSPRLKVKEILQEPMEVSMNLSAAQRDARTLELLERVGLPARSASLYPHEFSGGQRQRIAIARALSTNPKLVVLDEPVSALDLSIRAQILNLLLEIQRDSSVSYLMIAHDLGVIRHMSDTVCVMYLGQIVEYGPSDELYENPMHPYTKALFAAKLPLHPSQARDFNPIAGEVPSPIDPPSGCHFRTRCPHATAKCAQSTPGLAAPGANEHRVACFLFS